MPLANLQFNQTNVIGVLNAINDKKKDLDLLSKIASLKYFKVFIIASFFKEFEKEFRNKNRDEEIEIFKNSLDGNHNLTNVNFNNGKRKIIYLFDNIDSKRFALNDGELLESLYGLSNASNDKTSSPLPSALSGKTLLFIGCDFSDWFMRYCIRVLYNMPFDKPQRTYVVNDNPPDSTCQLSFFNKHGIQLFQTSPVSDFINEFWKEAMPKQKFENRFGEDRVFICYSHSDKKIAQTLCDYLRNSKIDAWFDEEDKTIASHLETIRKNIWDPKTKLMISLISRAFVDTLSEPKNDNYVRDIEWDAAVTRVKAAEFRNKDDKFCIVPYFVDDPSDYIKDKRIPDVIREQFQFGESSGGFKQLYDAIEKVMSND